ncbi:hypothetical protein CO230_07915 [Chryseobacterium sp. 6424]|uniref:hypothetical protein n=1 Tax=Chryseobacterium sp. 6424 TaxID=2039166 RepID=UPI000EFB6C73|nr:hypothetical protein [Chryseobacterium sp. 6424]AYO58052.1 hypothetical protein CO230_07915 [Chryseobacterium sp. 6424]
MKYILEIILTVIIIFFLWNILKRLFFTAFYRFPKPPNGPRPNQSKTKASKDPKLNWDAETVEYEEVKENKDHR